jgi:glycosyltransferase involved in cell wall biosynthesis
MSAEPRDRQGTGFDSQADVRITVVVPVKNAIKYLPMTMPPLIAAARNAPGTELIYVDNGSIDGSYEYLKSRCHEGIRVERFENGISAATRNFGAARARGEFLSFIDADCVVAPDYFRNALQIMSTGAAATGCEVEAPRQPHWIEATWHDLHYVGRERDVHYLNSGNFFVRRDAFEQIGRFNEHLPSGADAEMGQRLTNAGFRIRESPLVGAIHLGNPKSIREFYRRNVWHGTGMLGTFSWRRIDKPTAMMVVHLLASVSGVVYLLGGSASLVIRLAVACLAQVVAPIITVAYRAYQTRRFSRLGSAIPLYWLYYWARLQALAFVVIGAAHDYQKSGMRRGATQ